MTEEARSCLDMLRSASALLARHKGEIAGLLPRDGAEARGELERLVADLTEMLCTGTGTMGAVAAVEEEGAARPASPVRSNPVEQAQGQQQDMQSCEVAQQQQQQEKAEGSASSGSYLSNDALGMTDVLEHVMSFADGRELVGPMGCVSRLWSSVSGREGLCLAAVEREMPSAVLGGTASLHARLGASAKRCLLAREAWRRPRSPVSEESKLEGLRGLIEIVYGEKVLFAAQGRLLGSRDEGWGTFWLHWQDGDADLIFSPALGEAGLHAMFESERVRVRYCVMHVETGVTLSLFDAPFICSSSCAPSDGPFYDGSWWYQGEHVPWTSMTLAGEPFTTEVEVMLSPVGQATRPVDGPQCKREIESIASDPERLWSLDAVPLCVASESRYGEGQMFLLARLAEEFLLGTQ